MHHNINETQSLQDKILVIALFSPKILIPFDHKLFLMSSFKSNDLVFSFFFFSVLKNVKFIHNQDIVCDLPT